ncbi:hypothetical protein D3C77_576310 [compost metagenome]
MTNRMRIGGTDGVGDLLRDGVGVCLSANAVPVTCPRHQIMVDIGLFVGLGLFPLFPIGRRIVIHRLPRVERICNQVEMILG